VMPSCPSIIRQNRISAAPLFDRAALAYA